MKIILTTIILLLGMHQLQAQNLGNHRWENRLLLLLTDEPNNVTFKSQLRLFQNHKTGLEERKLLIYQITPKAYKTGLSLAKKWLFSTELFPKYKVSNTTYEVVLIGLDGGVKLRQNTLLRIENLFGIIDGMPMRRAEIEGKKY